MRTDTRVYRYFVHGSRLLPRAISLLLALLRNFMPAINGILHFQDESIIYRYKATVNTDLIP